MSLDIFKTLSVIRGSLRYNLWLYNSIRRHLRGIVLDVGSGLGDIARLFEDPSVEEVILSDYDPRMLQALSATAFPLKKYRLLPLDITNSPHNSLLGGIADTITCINVLEHIEQDECALKNLKYYLKKKGKVVLFVPALPFIYGTLDNLVDHHRRYTKESLRAVLQNAGYAIKDEYYMNILGILTWFLAGRVLRQKGFNKEACHMLDRIVPVLRRLESLGNPPLGQSLIMVGEKI